MSVSKQALIVELAKQLKDHLRKPEWADFVKTGVSREKPPVDSDWWYMRAASILFKVEKLGPVGVAKLRVKYGGRKNEGVSPDKTRLASGKIIRVILQQLEKEGLLKKDAKGQHKGRVLTPKARSILVKLAKAHNTPAKKAEKAAAPAEHKHEDKGGDAE